MPVYLDETGNVLPDDAPLNAVKTSVYTIKLKRGIQYQPHPAFAKDAQGNFLYHQLGDEARKYSSPLQFEQQGTRELTAHDYVYEIKRLASSRIVSPILGHMGDYVVGLGELSKTLQEHDKALKEKIQKKPVVPFHPPQQTCPGLICVNSICLAPRQSMTTRLKFG